MPSFKHRRRRACANAQSLTHEEVRCRIKSDELKTIAAVMSALGWNKADGCASCRPALNFYLLVRLARRIWG